MSPKSTHDQATRRSMLSGIVAAVAAWTAGTGRAAAQSAGTAFQPARHPQDEWLNALPGRHRAIIDCASPDTAGAGLLYANNLHDANKSGYQLNDSDLATVVCLRHFATVFAFADATWAKYGQAISTIVKFTDPKTRQAPTANLLNASGYGTSLPNMGVTIQALVGRGVQFAVCDTASHGLAGAIAGMMKADAETVYRDLVSNLIPNSHLVPAGVVAVNRAQEYGYTLLTAG